MAIPMAALLLFFAMRVFPVGSAVRRGGFFVLLFTLTEGAVGAVLVLFGLVAHRDSVSRTISMSTHMVNTFFLLGALIFTFWRRRVSRGRSGEARGRLACLIVAFASVLLLASRGLLRARAHVAADG